MSSFVNFFEFCQTIFVAFITFRYDYEGVIIKSIRQGDRRQRTISVDTARELFSKKSTSTQVSVAVSFMMVDAGSTDGYKTSDFRKKTEQSTQSWEQSTVSQVDNVVLIGLDSIPRLDASFSELLKKSCHDRLAALDNDTIVGVTFPLDDLKLREALDQCMCDVCERRSHFFCEAELGSAYIVVSSIFRLF
jgi:hypothetical protein